MDLWALIAGLDWKSILEQTVAGLIVLAIPLIGTFIFKKFFWDKRKKADAPQGVAEKNSGSIIKNPLLISLFFTLFTAMLTIFALFILGENLVVLGLLFLTMILLVATYLIYENQCPNCNRIFTKQLIHKETIKDEERPYRYRDEAIYKYSDGSFKGKKYTGKIKTIMEKWRTEKEFYECQKCHHKWDKPFEKNLDFNNRPKPNIVITRTKPPSD